MSDNKIAYRSTPWAGCGRFQGEDGAGDRNVRVGLGHGAQLRRYQVTEEGDDGVYDCQEYQVDRPYPSVLVLGRTREGRPLHVAYAPEDDRLIVIAVYEPDPNRWDEEFRQRRKP
jgi:hypothetical protein